MKKSCYFGKKGYFCVCYTFALKYIGPIVHYHSECRIETKVLIFDGLLELRLTKEKKEAKRRKGTEIQK